MCSRLYAACDMFDESTELVRERARQCVCAHGGVVFMYVVRCRQTALRSARRSSGHRLWKIAETPCGDRTPPTGRSARWLAPTSKVSMPSRSLFLCDTDAPVPGQERASNVCTFFFRLLAYVRACIYLCRKASQKSVYTERDQFPKCTAARWRLDPRRPTAAFRHSPSSFQ
jgi:hypothetical protein